MMEAGKIQDMLTATPEIISAAGITHKDKVAWRHIVEKYREPSTARALWQVANTFLPYAALWAAMYLCLFYHAFWLVVPLALLAGLFLVRIFIIFHDCGHGSFFPSHAANDFLGHIAGFLTFTPYYQWRWEHAVHHSTAGHLDKRGIGDIWTMTVEEYLQSSRLKRFAYVLARNPIVLFLLAPLYMFVVHQRYATKGSNARERQSVWWTNLALLLYGIGMSWLFGFTSWLLVQLIVLGVAGAVGVWMFYVQHQFEDVYWERGENWDYAAAALRGSSFYKLPAVLQWFSGNIGFHHIHHLSARIPNYNLQRCHEADPLFQQVQPLTFWKSFKTLNLRLWDEGQRKLVGYKRLREIRKLRDGRKQH
jgi:acyl-lipid omega-6 desaturase (Delta-12 desaturase)